VKFERFDQRHIAIAGPVRGNVMVNSTRPESFLDPNLLLTMKTIWTLQTGIHPRGGRFPYST
jgi:hypothetical protein